jgi:hypothetical protein
MTIQEGPVAPCGTVMPAERSNAICLANRRSFAVSLRPALAGQLHSGFASAGVQSVAPSV